MPAVTSCNQVHAQNADTHIPICRPVTSLGSQEGRRVFREGTKIFELCPIFLNYVQHIFPGGRKFFQRGLRPPCAHPLVTGLPICGAALLVQVPLVDWCRNLVLLAAQCIERSSPRCTWYYNCDSSCITSLLLHHKVFVSYHKNGLVIVTNVLADGLFRELALQQEQFKENSWLSTAYFSLCHESIRRWNHFAFM